MIFIENKYLTWYNNIISNAKGRTTVTDYTEIHHIVPKSVFKTQSNPRSTGWIIGDPNAANNLVRLTAREHFICHLLLPKIVPKQAKSKMTYALWSMTNMRNEFTEPRYRVTSHTFEHIRKLVSKTNRGAGHSQAKIYRVVDPSGKEYTIDDLKTFCKTHKLSYDAAIRLARIHLVGIRGSLQGWSFVDIHSPLFNTPFRSKFPGGNRKSYQITSPNKEMFSVTGELAKFCKEHRLDLDTMQQICKKKTTAKKGSCKGWMINQYS